jgi:hypothetical protein
LIRVPIDARLSAAVARLTPSFAIWLIASLLCPTTVRAQEQGPYPYFAAGLRVAVREGGYDFVTTRRPEAGTIAGIALSVGSRLTSALAVEGSIEAYRSRPVHWYYGYAFDSNGRRITRDRDLLFYGSIRLGRPCDRRVCVEALLGGGVANHAARTFALEFCPSLSSPPSARCTPVSPPKEVNLTSSFEPLIVFGAAVPVRLNRALSVAVSGRYAYIWRRTYLAYEHRGPRPGSGHLPGIGVDLMWSRR